MRLLYVSSCHPTLEYNDLSLFTEMGIQCFSTGIYADVHSPSLLASWRKSSVPNMNIDTESLNIFNRDNPTYHRSLIGYNRPRLNLSKDLVGRFDVVICNSFTHYVQDNWNSLKDTPTIWRTYGDSSPQQELEMNSLVLQGLKVVRGTSNELDKPNACEGSVISCHIDEDWYNGWTGEDSVVLSFQNAFHIRRLEAMGQAYLRIRNKSKAVFELYGDHPHPMVKGFLNFEDQLKAYQRSRVYFSIGSHPAPITYNFMEAMTTGMPVVTFGYKIGKAPKDGVPSYYQVPEFIENGITGFYSDNEDELREIIEDLLENQVLREDVSKAARKSAISMWGKETIKEKWKKYLEGVVNGS